MRASALSVGRVVKHSGYYHEVVAVRHQGVFACCITTNGGRVSFLSSDFIEVL